MQNNDTFSRFKKLLVFVFKNKYSDFYRHKYQRSNFNPESDFNSVEDIKKIPLLTREELSATEPSKLLFTKKEEVRIISVTSGTTGEPFFTFQSDYSFNFPSPLKTIKFGKCFFLANPIRANMISYYWKGERVWNLIGDIHNIPTSLQLASKLKVNTIYTTPTLAIILKDYLEQYPNLKKYLKFFWLGGEKVSPAKKKVLQELYPNLIIFLGYGISEAGGLPIAFQCPFLAKKGDQIYFHPWLNDFYFEIINSRTDKKAEEQKGELVLTTFFNPATPLIRYKTGDFVSFAENNCSCNFPGPLMQHLGRINYDSVRVGGFELRTEMLEKPLLNLKEFIQDSFEVHIYESFVENKPKIKTVLNLSLKNGIRESKEIKQRIENEILENWQLSPKLNLKKALEAKLFDPIQINFVNFQKFPKAQKKFILH